MIFSISNHVELIKKGEKTQTRRQSNHYEVGKTYAIQPCRTCKAIKDGRILILKKRTETFRHVNLEDAEAEGGYTPMEFEQLYLKIHPNWRKRFAYTFRFIPKEEVENHG